MKGAHRHLHGTPEPNSRQEEEKAEPFMLGRVHGVFSGIQVGKGGMPGTR